MEIIRVIIIIVAVTAAVTASAPKCSCTDYLQPSPPSGTDEPPAASDPCSGVVCRHGGTCEVNGDTFLCICKFGYEGEFCQDGIVLTSCGGIDCNRGECEEFDGIARCLCPFDDITGVFCELDLCLNVDCGVVGIGSFADLRNSCAVLGHLDLESMGDPFYCSCEDDLAEDRFCKRPRKCEFGERFCSFNGECIEDEDDIDFTDGSTTCNCFDGFSGFACQFGPCSDDICQNGGSCRYHDGEIFPAPCECKDGFEGDACEIVTCFGNSCENGGTCVVDGDTFTCLCPRDFGGDLCEIDTTTCFGVLCLNGGTCSGTSNDDAKCLCPDGISGDRCQFGNCLDQPSTFCMNGGTCMVNSTTSDVLNIYLSCLCAEGFSGVMCEVGPCPNDVVCQNGGKCVIVNGDFNSCRCRRGTFGDRCQFCECSEEGKNNCQNGATCNLVDGFEECMCRPGNEGRFCEITPACNGFGPCQNEGTCLLDFGSVTPRCSCRGLFRGEFCEDDPCSPGCQNGGTCTQRGSNFSCRCPEGFEGDFCAVELLP